jgi:hypothetical protein
MDREQYASAYSAFGLVDYVTTSFGALRPNYHGNVCACDLRFDTLAKLLRGNKFSIPPDVMTGLR